MQILDYWVLVSVVVTLYCLAPNYWLRNHSQHVIKRFKTSSLQVAITFDDGPNVHYTQKTLEILDFYQVKATFFVVGKNAVKAPEVVAKIAAKGHTIGCHSYNHFHHWLLTPKLLTTDIARAKSILTQITGKTVKYYRPPWGTFNIYTMAILKKMKLKPIYWSITSFYWNKNMTPKRIADNVLRQVRSGSIIVFHDNSHNKKALSNTLEALPLVIESLKSQGYHFITLDGAFIGHD